MRDASIRPETMQPDEAISRLVMEAHKALDDEPLEEGLGISVLKPTHLFEFFGGGSISGFTSMKDTAYCKLPRKMLLQSPLGLDIPDEAARRTYLRCAIGDLAVLWRIGINGEGLLMKIPVYKSDPPPYTEATLLYELNLVGTRCQSGILSSLSSCFDGQGCSIEFDAALGGDQKSALAHRTLHHFIRQHGSLLPYDLLDTAVCRLQTFYHGQKRYREAYLDVCMVLADVAITSGQSAYVIGQIFVKVGNQLEALGRFKEAANIFQESAETHLSNSSSLRSEVHRMAGLAFQKAGDFEEAEKEFVKALHFERATRGDLWSFNQIEKPSNLVMDFATVYVTWQDSAKGDDKGYARSMLYVFISLIKIAGFPVKREWFGRDIDAETKARLFKKTVQTKEGARHALLQATETQSVSSFQRALMEAIGDSDSLMYIGRHVDVPKLEPKLYKKMRSVHSIDQHASWSIFSCAYPGCKKMENVEGSEFKVCPCQSTQYC